MKNQKKDNTPDWLKLQKRLEAGDCWIFQAEPLPQHAYGRFYLNTGDLVREKTVSALTNRLFPEAPDHTHWTLLLQKFGQPKEEV